MCCNCSKAHSAFVYLESCKEGYWEDQGEELVAGTNVVCLWFDLLYSWFCLQGS